MEGTNSLSLELATGIVSKLFHQAHMILAIISIDIDIDLGQYILYNHSQGNHTLFQKINKTQYY